MPEDFDYLFAKSQLSKSTIDLGIGENHILRELVIEAYKLKTISFENFPNIFEYAPPQGYGPLVEKLESIYKAKVVVFSGAKSALSGAFYAMKATGKNKIHFRKPYWPSIPSLITRENLGYSFIEDECDCSLIVSPNNPDGYMNLNSSISGPIIHDAAYYTHSYLPKNIELKPFGDIQIFSVAKMYGISGARLGFAVCHNEEYYSYLMKFVEATTAGVSTPSQRILMHILDQEINNPEIRIKYENYVYDMISINRNYLYDNLSLNKNNIINYGMFAWVPSKIQNFNNVNVNIMGGIPFGVDNFIRINLAVRFEKIVKAVENMNIIIK